MCRAWVQELRGPSFRVAIAQDLVCSMGVQRWGPTFNSITCGDMGDFPITGESRVLVFAALKTQSYLQTLGLELGQLVMERLAEP